MISSSSLLLAALLFLLSDSVISLQIPILERSYTYPNKFGRHNIRYTEALGTGSKAPVVCVHGFGGNADQYRKNLPYWSECGHNAYAIDLLGYGYSSKPNPREYNVNEIYNFETWGSQTIHFLENVVNEPAVLVCNSIGGLVGLIAAIKRPDLVKGVVLINMSLRMLHTEKQSPFQRPITSAIQTLLRETSIGKNFFSQVAKLDVIKNILSQAYNSVENNVDDETVALILKPGLEEGAAEVFLDFISYSGGPLPEDLLRDCKVPVRILWGENDNWEPIKLGREFANYECVDKFVPLKDAGHCPMDQVPDQVNSEVIKYLEVVGRKN